MKTFSQVSETYVRLCINVNLFPCNFHYLLGSELICFSFFLQTPLLLRYITVSTITIRYVPPNRFVSFSVILLPHYYISILYFRVLFPCQVNPTCPNSRQSCSESVIHFITGSTRLQISFFAVASLFSSDGQYVYSAVLAAFTSVFLSVMVLRRIRQSPSFVVMHFLKVCSFLNFNLALRGLFVSNAEPLCCIQITFRRSDHYNFKCHIQRRVTFSRSN